MEILLIAAAIVLTATLYSTVGHGGGSGYLAVLAIASVAPETMRPTALLLNIVVATIATWKFGSSGSFRKDLFIPIVCVSIPAAFIGGYVEIPSGVYKPIVGAILIFASVRLFVPIRGNECTRTPALFVMCFAGGIIGLLSGLIGIGGGIFLSPLILLLGWANAKETAAVTAPFILVNSIAALVGVMTEHGELPVVAPFIAPLVVSVVVGGWIGATFGSQRLGHQGLRFVLGGVLLTASIKMFLPTAPPAESHPPIQVKSTP